VIGQGLGAGPDLQVLGLRGGGQEVTGSEDPAGGRMLAFDSHVDLPRHVRVGPAGHLRHGGQQDRVDVQRPVCVIAVRRAGLGQGHVGRVAQADGVGERKRAARHHLGVGVGERGSAAGAEQFPGGLHSRGVQ
jgi:hypothetical protein